MKHRILPTLAVALAFAAVAPAQTDDARKDERSNPGLTAEMKEDVLEEVASILTNRAFVPGVDFGRWPEKIASYDAQIEGAESTEDLARIVNRALQEFGLSHTTLFSPRLADRRRTNRIVGIGVRIQREDAGIRVTYLFPEAPASEAGLREGDLIKLADGEPMVRPPYLAGEEGTKVRLTVERDGQDLEIDVVRRPYSTIVPESITWERDRSVAVVAIPTFDTAYDASNVERIMREARSADAMILDLRGNGGGSVRNLRHLLGFFFETQEAIGTFVERRHYDWYLEEHESNRDPSLLEVAAWVSDKVRPLPRRQQVFEGQVAVLVDGSTGSASEMIAAALRELRESPIVGRPTAGAVLASYMRRLPHNFMLQFPITDYVTIAGMRIEGNGVLPDIQADRPRWGENDDGVLGALNALDDLMVRRAS